MNSMNKRLALILITLILTCSFPISYASLPSTSTPEEKSDAKSEDANKPDDNLDDTDTLAPKDDEETPASDTKPQAAPGDMSNLPSWVKPELVEKYGYPADGDFTGFDDEGRAYLRSIGISGAEMRAMDDFVKRLKDNPNAWKYGCDQFSDGVCLDAVNVGFYKLFSQNPLLYAGGPNPDKNNPTLQNYINSDAYALANTSSPPTMTDIGGTSTDIIPGTIAIGGAITPGAKAGDPGYKYHISMYWKTDEDAAGLTNTPNGTWVAQTVGPNNWDSLISTDYKGSIYPVARPDGPIYNPDGLPTKNSGWVPIPSRWTTDVKNNYPTPTTYGTIPLSK